MSAGFTPGPWARPDDDVYAVFAWPDGVATSIADCNSGQRVVQDDDECAANANLIAAAPALYEALEGLATLHPDWANRLGYTDELEAALAALKQARGEQ